jgi:D-alanyl-D-alanine carboxypeptidase/D-alanyl-D-alanine-endopeptidase (penicillin-binding protein 4)
MKRFLPFALYFLPFTASAQTVSQRLQKAFRQFETDSQLKHAISSLYVIDAKTGQVIFDKNSQIGLAPASTQKIITSVTAFELLGKEYRYKTEFYYEKPNKNLLGDIALLKGAGDPTFGSWRYSHTTPSTIFTALSEAFYKNNLNLKKITFFVVDNSFEKQSIPDGWIWQDIGNYYGAGVSGFNWKENQVNVELSSNKNIGDPVKVENYDSLFSTYTYFDNAISAAAKNTGDNAYYYFGYNNSGRGVPPLFKGTIPVDERNFKISIAVSDPQGTFVDDFSKFKNIKYDNSWLDNDLKDLHTWIDSMNSPFTKPIYTHYSPSLDSIIYWLNKKSINLYAEALIKTFAYEKQGFGSTDSGVAIVKKFWKEKGLDENELNMYDGSGLSPLNRVTTHAQVEILKYAKTKEWFPYFLQSLPDYNGMTMKSGTITDVKGFCGYHKAKNGKEYIFSFLVNNYSGKTSVVVGKMYKVLDELK